MSGDCPTTPSSASVCDVLTGKPGGIPKLAGHWLLRSALMMPGLYIAGVRDKRLITGALAGSTLITFFLVAFTAVQQSRLKRAANRSVNGRRRRLAP
jgi:hypothetical protein